MPAPNLATLQADPPALLEWLNDNLLISGTLANVPNPAGTARVRFEQVPDVPFPPHAVNMSGRPLGVYQLRSNGTGDHNSVRSYVCNYTPNAVETVTLGSAGDYCFTTNLNGCTFGIGPAVRGVRRVSHANTGGNSLAQRNQTWNAHGVAANSLGIKMLEPAEYRRLNTTTNLQATVFGIRRGLNWSFYYQVYNAVGNCNYQVRDVIRISTP